MNAATLRTNFPEFADTSSYPDGTVNFWLSVADKMVNEERWGSQKDFGVQLFTAHNLVLAKSNVDVSANGGLPGQTSGPTQSKTVGSVSVSYDTNAALEMNGGHWNMTTYGKQFVRLSRVFGAGAYQL